MQIREDIEDGGREPGLSVGNKEELENREEGLVAKQSIESLQLVDLLVETHELVDGTSGGG